MTLLAGWSAIILSAWGVYRWARTRRIEQARLGDVNGCDCGRC